MKSKASSRTLEWVIPPTNWLGRSVGEHLACHGGCPGFDSWSGLFFSLPTPEGQDDHCQETSVRNALHSRGSHHSTRKGRTRRLFLHRFRSDQPSWSGDDLCAYRKFKQPVEIAAPTATVLAPACSNNVS